MQYLSNHTSGSRPCACLKFSRIFWIASHLACGSSDHECEMKTSTDSKFAGFDFW